MNMSGTSRFWVIAAIIAGATVSLAASQPTPDWSYTYTDDFQTSKIDTDSYFHSIIWPEGAYPPSEPYLYYTDSGELGFGDFHDQPAQLAYRFPFPQGLLNKTISGSLQVDVRFLNVNAGSQYSPLQYSISSDGVIWSTRKNLVEGTNIIPMKSVRGVCYIVFYGNGAFIDNLLVNLYSYPANYFVPTTQYPTIQSAINAASDGDTIEVAQGTYKDTGNVDIDFLGKEITLYARMGPDLTIIDCENSHRGFYFHNIEDSNSVLRGFTIKNGKKTGSNIPSDTATWTKSAANPVGAGIYCEFSSPVIINCKIQQCSTELGAGIGIVAAAPVIADSSIEYCSAGGLGTAQSGGYGAGIAMIRDSNAVIINSQIKYNSAYINSKGAGVYCYQSKALLSNCEISYNSAAVNVTGGGVYAGGLDTNIELLNCIIANNIAQSGAGIYTDSINVQYINDPDLGSIAITCVVHITNCTITNNKLALSQGVTGSGIHSIKSNTLITNSIIWGNQEKNVYLDNSIYTGLVFYSDVQGGYDGQGNKDVDPCFASSANNDYHLKSDFGRYDPVLARWVYTDTEASRSSCIDAGDPQDQVGPEPYPNGKRINMGAYGGTIQASKNYSPRLIHVAKTGNNYNSGTSREDAFAKIQDAVDDAKNGDYIMIWPGVYYEDVFLIGKKVIIQSADEPAEIRASGYAFSFYTAETSGCVLRNLIITNCGEGAVLMQYASPQLINLTIANNAFGINNDFGASHPIITNCIFYNNAYGDMEDADIYNTRYSRMDKTAYGDLNITDSPEFYNPNPANGDYHLKSRNGRYSSGLWKKDSINSPCIDAGDPSMYPDREPQPNGGFINMGAYGGTPFASKGSSSGTYYGLSLY